MSDTTLPLVHAQAVCPITDKTYLEDKTSILSQPAEQDLKPYVYRQSSRIHIAGAYNFTGNSRVAGKRIDLGISLPDFARPEQKQAFSTTLGGAACNLYVDTDGTITAFFMTNIYASGVYFALSGLSWPAKTT